MAGRWMISGTPAFDRATGRFAGYRGVAERTLQAKAVPAYAEIPTSDPDSLRDLAHEIKTPLNAIIGFAEIISGQYLGPANYPYRERAAEIAVQAHLLLTAVEDLDFAAKLHSHTTSGHAQVHMGELVERVVPSLRQLADSRKVRLEVSWTARDFIAAVEPELAERLIFRMGTAMVESAGAGESLWLSVDNGKDECRVSMSRPKALQALSNQELFGSSGESLTQAFPLRLTRGLARIAGAQLIASESTLSLVFRSAPLGGEQHGVYF